VLRGLSAVTRLYLLVIYFGLLAVVIGAPLYRAISELLIHIRTPLI
jgi:hypothetical protein